MRQASSQELAAEANLTTTRANFRRIIGNEPAQLAPASPVDRYLPETLRDAADISLAENPNVTAAMYGIDVNFLNVKVNEGALFPTVTLQANVQKSWQQTITQIRQFNASAVAQVSVPIYQGGAEYSLIRQSKETLEQQRLNLEQVRDQARADLVTAWGQLLAGKAQVTSSQSQVDGVGDRPARHAARKHRRPAHRARRAERTAGAGQCPRRARDRRA